ncbi:MAG: sigma 54-interacting transcriptional regulator [Desulfobacterales bacterium]|jgi:PAS domain S-box-containing protein|nr:sigma 54-interacting transcriptional regulator [Desulfobacterales bacterium]MDH3876793.1 sigma 54-interacting transcriptional regulator [Desulfobacterales bacterium]MDH4009430.1 sigma 54-interacting transcriptional regulator [Desulfobacterales bacterium]
MRKIPNYEQFLQFSNHGVIATDKDGRIQFVNKRAREILKFIKTKMNGVHIAKLLPKTSEMVAQCLATGKPQLERQIAGKRVNLIVNINPIIENKTVTGCVCNFLRLDEFESTAWKLESFDFLDRQFKTVFESSSDGIWICDKKGRVVLINKASEKLGGIKKEDIIGTMVSDLVKKKKLYSNYVTDEVIQTKRVVSQLQHVKNTKKTVLCTGIPVFDRNGRVSLVVINERDITQLEALKIQLEETRKEKDRYKNELTELSMLELKRQKIVSESDQMREILKTALKLARLEVTDILLLGESGTGKGLLAKFIHNNSKRKRKPFIQINCAALPENLLEAELFGYEKGAFSGAREQGKPGLFELAHEGTLFLDEIGELPFSVQAKLLKYLDDHKVQRLGGIKAKSIDCIIIAATNQDIEKFVGQKKFRKDLFYRLNILTIKIPPLRERPEDIFELANSFLRQYNRKYKQKKKLNPLALSLLQSYSFAGNVRELKNIIKKAVVMSEGEVIDSVILSSIGKEVLEDRWEVRGSDKKINNLVDMLAALEKEMLKNAMRHCKSTREMARFLNISQPTVVRKLKKHSLPPPMIQT